MNVSKALSPLIIFFSITCLWISNSYSFSDNASFMDLESYRKGMQYLVNRNSRGIVSVAVYDDTGALRNSGSGFFIDNEGRIITSSSIWRNAYSAEVSSDLNTYREVVILNRSEDLDIAIIKVKEAHEIPLELDFNHKTNLGDRVIVIGKIKGRATISEGLISAVPETEGNLNMIEIQTVASILPYNTSNDGPLVSTDGKVIGFASNAVVDGKIYDGAWRGFNDDKMYAASLSSIKHLLSESGRIEHLQPARSKVWVKWFVSYLKSIVLKGFIYLYEIGFGRLIAILFVTMIIIYIAAQLYIKYIKPRDIM